MNGIYLFLLLKEIRDKLVGSFIDKVLIQERLVQIVCGTRSLFVSLFPEAMALYVSDIRKDEYEAVEPFNKSLQASRITSIVQENFLPVLRVNVEGAGEKDAQAIFSFYREAPNFSVRTEQGQRNLFPRYREKKPKRSILEVTADEVQVYAAHGPDKLAEYLIKRVEGIDKYCAEELTSERLQKLQKILRGEAVKPRLVSFKPLHVSLFSSPYLKEYSSFNALLKDATEKFFEAKKDEQRALKQRDFRRRIQKRIERLQKKVLSTQEVEDYRIMGELILTHSGHIKKGMNSVRVFNPYVNEEIEIKLDPQKTPQANAQLYFIRYKKIKRGAPIVYRKIEELKREVQDFEAGLVTAGRPAIVKQGAEKEKPLPFRVFNLASGSVVYVGKHARSNEELTFSFARPHDYFFHIRGYEGPHTILRAQVPRGQKPKREDIEQAASIAAYFSKVKGQHNVPVSYTQRKYLKKNKKGKPGSVILMREEVLFVDPGLPESKFKVKSQNSKV